jgi:hypothetical protein
MLKPFYAFFDVKQSKDHTSSPSKSVPLGLSFLGLPFLYGTMNSATIIQEMCPQLKTQTTDVLSRKLGEQPMSDFQGPIYHPTEVATELHHQQS